MTGIIVTTPPAVELPPGNASGPATLPGVTYSYAVLNVPQTWGGVQTFPLGTISVQWADVVGKDYTPAYFTQTGTGAVPVSYDSIVRGTVVTPEMFGYSGSGDAGPAIQRAIDSVPGAVTVVFGQHNYNIVTPVVINKYSVSLLGQGDSTTLQFQPTTNNATMITWYSVTLTGGIYYGRIRDMRIVSSNTTLTKTAINLIDIGDMEVSGLVIGPSWTGANSIGLKTNGRQCSKFDRLDIFADRPIVIAANTNSVQLCADHFHFSNLYLIANGNPCIEAESGVVFSDTTFDGYQAWVSGTHGFYYNGTTSPGRGYNLSFSNVRTEGGTDPAAYSFYVNPLVLASFSLTNCVLDPSRKGIYGRNLLNVNLQSLYFALATTREALNFDSTCDVISTKSCRWEVGATQAMAGLTEVYRVQGPTGTSAAVFPEALYTKSVVGLSLQTPYISNATFTDLTTFAGSTSGSTILKGSAVASGTLTLPAATDTLVGKATTDTLTNKTISGASNTLNVRIGSDVSGLGTGISAALAIAPNATGGFVTFNGALGVVTATTVNGAAIDNLAWTAYTPVLTSEAGGAIGTGQTITGFWKQSGKTVHVRIKIIMGATGLGTATQIGISLPSTAVGDVTITADNRTSGAVGGGKIGAVGLTKALLSAAGGGILGGNNDTMVISGTYEQS